MKPDVSVAPELAQLIAPGPAPAAGPPPHPAAAGPLPTAGRLAGQLRLIAAAPDRWWELVRFDPSRPVRVEIPAERWCEAWLMILPGAGHAGRAGGNAGYEAGYGAGYGAECGCEVATAVAGAAAEEAAAARPAGSPGAPAAQLVPGRVRVHSPGRAHRVVNRGTGYTVSMHARARDAVHLKVHSQFTR